MLKKIMMILVLMLVLSNGAFACCAFCNASLWDLVKIFVLPPLVWLISFIFLIQGIYIFFVENRKLALLRTIPFILLMGWILSYSN